MHKEIIDRLRDDAEYYGDFGKQFLSSSDMKVLNEQPHLFHKDSDEGDKLPLLKGAYFHTIILEPHKITNFILFDGASRNSNKYKEHADENGMCLLIPEADEIKLLKDTILEKEMVKALIYADGNEYEIPMVSEIKGKLFKGKADILNHSKKLVIDLKTTADITRFKWSAKDYYYDSQAFIYREHFGYDVIFLVACKKTGVVKIFTCSEDFYASGEDRVTFALERYDMFYGADAIEDADQYVEQIEL